MSLKGGINRDVPAIIIGAGQAGLAVSHYLTEAKQPHIILERTSIGATWRNERWDNFCLVTPNWMTRLPGFLYSGPDADGFMSRDEIAQHLEDYASSFEAPVVCGVNVNALIVEAGQDGYLLETKKGRYGVHSVFVTTGSFNRPKIPQFAERIPKRIDQMHSSQYRNARSLKDGAVLVVGSAQSGCQIVEDLLTAGRTVFLSVGSAGRQPRRYRGKDICYWLDRIGAYDRSFKDPSNPVERFQPNPHCSGRDGGHAINLRGLTADGVFLLGRAVDAAGDTMEFRPDLEENLAKADAFSTFLRTVVDQFIAASGIEAPQPEDSNTDDGVPGSLRSLDSPTQFDLGEQQVSTIVWATGYNWDFSWIKLPLLDDWGYPKQTNGISDYPGLYFCGLHWMQCLKSGLLFGVDDAASHVTNHFLNNVR